MFVIYTCRFKKLIYGIIYGNIEITFFRRPNSAFYLHSYFHCSLISSMSFCCSPLNLLASKITNPLNLKLLALFRLELKTI